MKYYLSTALLLLLLFITISSVSSNEFNCEPGYGVFGEAAEPANIITTGRCRRSIDTVEECKALAAKYNANGVDPNEGFIDYGVRTTGKSGFDPYGCFKTTQNYPRVLKYTLNLDTNNLQYKKCTEDETCICQPIKCRKCPINTYSNGGKNAKCLKCPYDNPVTNGKIGQKSCEPLVCKNGEGIERESTRTSGVCISPARNEDDCNKIASNNWENDAKPDRYGGNYQGNMFPYGCYTSKAGSYSDGEQRLRFNSDKSGIQCDADVQMFGPVIKNAFTCFCRINTCGKCPNGFTSAGGPNAECIAIKKVDDNKNAQQKQNVKVQEDKKEDNNNKKDFALEFLLVCTILVVVASVVFFVVWRRYNKPNNVESKESLIHPDESLGISINDLYAPLNEKA